MKRTPRQQNRPGPSGKAPRNKPIRQPARPGKPRRPGKATTSPADESIRLNRFIAQAGVCSRREADTLISTGAIQVNGRIVTELGTKVQPGDIVLYGGQRLHNEKKVYLLLNKPKDYITTTDDPHERKTVLQLVRSACKERIYPVGRLDRNTTGLLLFTNDGELAKKLSHPRHGVPKLYHVFLDKALRQADLEKMTRGMRIDNQLVVPDQLAIIAGAKGNKEVGLEIHSGQNRVVRRLFESMGYKVVKLDRVSYAGLTKKDLPRGKWRFLTDKEVAFLKMRA